jgi:hypothetical protein
MEFRIGGHASVGFRVGGHARWLWPLFFVDISNSARIVLARGGTFGGSVERREQYEKEKSDFFKAGRAVGQHLPQQNKEARVNQNPHSKASRPITFLALLTLPCPVRTRSCVNVSELHESQVLCIRLDWMNMGIGLVSPCMRTEDAMAKMAGNPGFP